MAAATGQLNRPVARGVPNAFDRQPPQLYAFVNEIEEVPETDDQPAHWLVDMECLGGEWFDATWAKLKKSEEDIRAFIDKVQGSRRLDEVYHKLNPKTRELFYRVHMHYQMLTVSKEGYEEKEAPVSLVQMVVGEGNPLRKNDINESTWYELNLGDPVELDRDAPHGAQTDGTTVQAILGLSIEDDSPLTEQPVLVFKEPDKETQAVLLALYFPQYLDEKPMDDPGDGQVIEEPMDAGGEGNVVGEKRAAPDPIDDSDKRPVKFAKREGDADIAGDGGGGPPDGGGGGDGGGPAPPPGPPVNPMIYHPGLGSHQPFVGVMNIGTGHCIALFGRNGQIIAYTDFGHPMGFYYRTYPGYAAGAPHPYPCVCSDPVMVLSHWDYDHYSMVRRVPQAFQLRWIAPQQFMGPAAARELYTRVLLNVAAGNAQACLHLWPAGVNGSLTTPCGYFERGNGPNPLAAGGRNDSGLISYVRIQDDPAAIPPANWPPVFNAPGGPLLAGAGAPLPGAVPALAALPAGAVVLAPVGFAPPPTTANQRYILLPGDVSFLHIPSQGVVAPPLVVGLVATHHGSDSWMPALPPFQIPPAPGFAGGAPAPFNDPQAAAVALINAAAVVAAGAAGAAPAAVPPNPVAAGGRIAYSYGVRATVHPNGAAGSHPYTHPRAPAVAAYVARGWTSRMNASWHDYHSLYPYPNPWVNLADSIARVPPACHRAGYVALGWQIDNLGAGMTYFWQDVLPAPPPGGAAMPVVPGPGADIVRNCAAGAAACTRRHLAGGPPVPYTFTY